MVSLQNVTSHGSINHIHVKNPYGKQCMDVASLQYMSLNVRLEYFFLEKLFHNYHIGKVSPHMSHFKNNFHHIFSPQIVHWCDHSPICVLTCPNKLLLSEDGFSIQLYWLLNIFFVSVGFLCVIFCKFHMNIIHVVEVLTGFSSVH